MLLLALGASSQTPVAVGRISGGDFRVRGQVEFAADGSTLLLSGAEVDVRRGVALLRVAGGQARFCGPLKVVVLKSAAAPAEPDAAQETGKPPADTPLLFAVFSNDSGAIELDYNSAAPYTIQTPFFSISTLPAGEATPRRAAVRVGTGGEICAAALAGSLRVREQIGTSDLLIPPGKAMTIPAGGVDKAMPAEAVACGCVVASTKAETAAPEKPVAAPAVAAEKKAPPDTDTTIATAPLVYKAQSGGTPKPAAAPKEPEVTIPVVMAGPQPATAPAAVESAQAPPAVQTAKTNQGAGFGSKLKRLFRFLFGSRSS